MTRARRAVLALAVICLMLVGAFLVLDRDIRGGYLVAAPGAADDLAAFRRDLQAITDHGGEWVRFAVRAYDVVEDWDDGGTIAFDAEGLETVDTALDLARQAGLTVYLVTADTVPVGILDASGRDYLGVMTEYWRGLAMRYGDRVDVWQVFNEADGLHFRTAQSLGDGPPADYLAELAEVLDAAARTIRSLAPGVRVTTTAGGYPVDDAMEERWARFFGAVGGPLDVLAVGLYPQADYRSIDSLTPRLERLRSRMDHPVIVAEVGLQTCRGCFTEADQGTYLAATLRGLRRAPVEAVLVYELRDSDSHGFGVLHRNWTPKEGAAEIGESLRRL